MKSARYPLGQMLFSLSVLTLLANDWYGKQAYHNAFTGKLSDVAGLFALSYLVSALWPKRTVALHLLIGATFVWWKSDYSQPAINWVCDVGIPIGRTVDLTDLFGLVSVMASYWAGRHTSPIPFRLRPVVQQPGLLMAAGACMATTLAPHQQKKFVSVDKTYAFNCSKRELVSRLNMVQLQEVRSLNKVSGTVDFNAQTNTFHFQGRADTLALLLDYATLRDQDTVVLRTSFAEIQLAGNEGNSTLKLLSVYKFVPVVGDKDYRAQAIRQFEKRIVKKVKNYR